MKNITVSLDGDALGRGETEAERLKREERALRERIGFFRASDRLPRNELYKRAE